MTKRFVRSDYVLVLLLQRMQTSRTFRWSSLLTKYGETAGVITVEDIVEGVEIEDEFDPDNKYLTRLSDREWLR